MRILILSSIVILLCGVLGSGCGQAVDTKSVAFYENNDQARSATLKRCKELKGDPAKDEDCVNAQRAAFVAANKQKPMPKADFSGVPVAK